MATCEDDSAGVLGMLSSGWKGSSSALMAKVGTYWKQLDLAFDLKTRKVKSVVYSHVTHDTIPYSPYPGVSSELVVFRWV